MPPWRLTRSRRPTRLSTQSIAATSATCRTSWATCCCRWSFTPGSARRSVPFPSRTSSQASAPRWCAGTRTSSTGRRSARPRPASTRSGTPCARNARRASALPPRPKRTRRCTASSPRWPKAGEGKPALSNELWETIKAEERKAKGDARGGVPAGLLAGITPALPGLTRAVKLQRKAATVGFDWSDAKLVLAKIREEGRRDRARGGRCLARGGRGRDRRPSVRGGQPRASPQRRSGDGGARCQRQVRAPFRAYRGPRSPPRAPPRRTPRSTRWRRCGARRRPRGFRTSGDASHTRRARSAVSPRRAAPSSGSAPSSGRIHPMPTMP